jgi:hypothetical protein
VTDDATASTGRTATGLLLVGFALVADAAAGGRIAARVGSRRLVALAGFALVAAGLSARAGGPSQ